MRRIGSRAVSWLVAVAVMAMLSPVSMSFAAQNGANTVNSAAIIAADGVSGQTLTTGSGVKTGHIQDGAVTASKLGIVCANGEYLQYVFGSGWVCNVGTAGPAGPQGPTGPEGPAGATPHYANVVVVSKSSGDFTDIAAAINSITDASATNPYLVKIMPGTYDLTNTLYMPGFVDIEGSGQNTTVLVSSSPGSGIVVVDNNEIRALTLQHSGSNGIMTGGGSPKITNVTISGTNESNGILNSSSPVIDNVTIIENSYGSKGIMNEGGSITIKNSNITGHSSGVMNYLKYASSWSANVAITNSQINSIGGYAVSNVNYSMYAPLPSIAITKVYSSILTAPFSIQNMGSGAEMYLSNTQLNSAIQNYAFLKCIGLFDNNFDPVTCN